jgi:hypothetical protein
LRPADLLNLLQGRPFAVVECIGIGGFEVHQSGDAFRVPIGDRAQLFSGDGMSREHRSGELERVQDSEHIVTEAVCAVTLRRKTRFAEAASCNAVSVVTGRQLGCKIIEYMRCVSSSGEKNNRPTGTAPIEHFQLYVFLNANKLHGMRGYISPQRGLL